LQNFVLGNALQVAGREIMKRITNALFVVAILFALVIPSLADTVKLKDGSVIHGQVVGFKDQQFIILVGGGSRGRRSSITVYMEDVESIDFDSSQGGGTATSRNEDSGPPPRTSEPVSRPSRPSPTPIPDASPSNSEPATTEPVSSAPPTFFTIKVTVRADNVNNGWSNTGLVVRRGQRLRITASGRVDLGKRGFATPNGLPTMVDNDRLMRTEPTGGLIGVIGDDNDDFIFLGARREFVSQRDGVLFLGVNEGDLTDNKGSYDVVIEAEAGGRTP
jgi:hypothetical protein